MKTFIILFFILYFTGSILALGIAASTPPVKRSRKIDISALITLIFGSWFSVGICIGVIIDYLQDINDELLKLNRYNNT